MSQPKMATTTAVAVAMLAVATLAGVASGEKAGGFVVTGRVYCDPCRAGFETNVSKSVPGATVEVVCRRFGSSKETLKAEATTDEYGWYKLEIDQDHQEEICEAVLAKSSDPACAEVEEFRDRARVPLTSNNGIKQQGVRYANPIAFFRKDPLADCGTILNKYDLNDATETP
ncbi:pollen allergen Phl p 11-like [Panicum virgatum]|uniref:pollen allergen Phl p 11-like n=1 Tax=Panicum virgatum TaxID=38727 RepID=UPI0019D65C55|nr:pollen allergen Phl p 11-like [Panicum virgatum]